MEVDINLSCGSMKLMKHSTCLSHTSYNPWRLMAPPNMLILSRFSCKTHSKCVCVCHFCADDKPAFLQLKHRILKMRQWSRWNLTTGIMFTLASSSTWLRYLTYFLENKHVPWKSMVGRCISYSNSPLLWDMLVFGGVFCLFFLLPVSCHAGSIWWIAGFQAKAEGGRSHEALRAGRCEHSWNVDHLMNIFPASSRNL